MTLLPLVRIETAHQGRQSVGERLRGDVGERCPQAASERQRELIYVECRRDRPAHRDPIIRSSPPRSYCRKLDASRLVRGRRRFFASRRLCARDQRQRDFAALHAVVGFDAGWTISKLQYLHAQRWLRLSSAPPLPCNVRPVGIPPPWSSRACLGLAFGFMAAG
jgi:hypothetical protein